MSMTIESLGIVFQLESIPCRVLTNLVGTHKYILSSWRRPTQVIRFRIEQNFE